MKTFSKEFKEVDNYAAKIQRVLDLAYKESMARGIFYGMVSFYHYLTHLLF